MKDLESSIEKITDRVKQLLELEVGKVSCASTLEPKKKNLKILDSISQVMFNELGFKKNSKLSYLFLPSLVIFNRYALQLYQFG